MLSVSLTLNSSEIAELYLKRSAKTFLNIRGRLYDLGFPRPIDLGVPSDPIWLREDVEDWFKSRPRCQVAPVLPREAPEPSQSLPAKRGRGRPRKAQGGV